MYTLKFETDMQDFQLSKKSYLKSEVKNIIKLFTQINFIYGKNRFWNMEIVKVA